MKKRLIALACAVIFCIGLLPARAVHVDEVYFTSVNDILIRPLTAETMPAEINGLVYVPASVFDNTVTGVNLGMYCNQSSTNNVVTLYSLRQMLVFDLGRGITYDQHSGEQMPAKAINRNGRIYLPMKTVCDFFKLDGTCYYTKYGRLVRIRNSAAWQSDAEFIKNAGPSMENALREFLREQQPVEPPQGAPDDNPPVQPPEPLPEKIQVQVNLAFRCETGEGLETILNRLDETNCLAFFFFSPDVLSRQDDLVRRVVGQGHGIGVLVQGETPDQSRQQLSEANRVLQHVARTAATAVLAPDSQCGQLEQAGWACWRETGSGLRQPEESMQAQAQRIIQSIVQREGMVYVTLDDSLHTAQMLRTLLPQLKQQECVVALPLETTF